MKKLALAFGIVSIAFTGFWFITCHFLNGWVFQFCLYAGCYIALGLAIVGLVFAILKKAVVPIVINAIALLGAGYISLISLIGVL